MANRPIKKRSEFIDSNGDYSLLDTCWLTDPKRPIRDWLMHLLKAWKDNKNAL